MNTVVTDLAVIDVTKEGLVLREVAPGWSAEEVQQRTEAKLGVSGRVAEMKLVAGIRDQRSGIRKSRPRLMQG